MKDLVDMAKALENEGALAATCSGASPWRTSMTRG